ncbi:MAG TPA: class I SAM-dependent methyltransferase [Spirochaetes bacterium]|nr:class I SAM-dependent methyltransferase [Spirochaetota bacterium]
MKGQDLKNVKLAYDTVAKEYAAAYGDEHSRKPMDREMLERFAREIGGRGPVWDLGCGPGQTARYLKDRGVDIAGLDLSGKLLAEARKLSPDISFRQGDMLALDFDDGTVAGIVAFYAIVHFIKDQAEAAFREIFRVLEPGGLFLLTFHIGDETLHVDEFLGKKIEVDFMFFTTEFIAGCLKKCGFNKIDLIEREPYPDVEYRSRRAYVFAVKPRAAGG